ncbi:MAG: hypothetical protein IJV14_02680 [Lachnospiraceae bacterium]|nr:hypothetical protein [Lachnospiraceae bacterium]
MKYRIEHESNHRIRIRIFERMTPSMEEVLEYALTSIDGVKEVSIYPATDGIAIRYVKNRDRILAKLDRLRFDNVVMMSRQIEKSTKINAAEIRERTLDPALKRKLRMRIVAEALADAVLPLPVQTAYHVYQLVTLKDI